MPTTEEADYIADFLAGVMIGARRYLQDAAADQATDRLASAVRHADVRRRVGGRVSVELDLVGRPEPQADAFRGFVQLATGTLATMRKRARANEARARVIDIAQRLAAHAEANRRGHFRLPTLPESAPAVPATVPAGAPTPVATADWSHPTWQALAFHLEGAAHHSYSIELSRDRRVATVRAVADLDGDGATSRLELSVRISARGEVKIDPELHAENELD
jgi:hypothetical protein